MSCWQYAQLTITVDGRALREDTRTIVWRGPGQGLGENYSDRDQTVLELLNRFGADGWELAGLQDYREGGDESSSYWEATRLLTIYTFSVRSPGLALTPGAASFWRGTLPCVTPARRLRRMPTARPRAPTIRPSWPSGWTPQAKRDLPLKAGEPSSRRTGSLMRSRPASLPLIPSAISASVRAGDDAQLGHALVSGGVGLVTTEAERCPGALCEQVASAARRLGQLGERRSFLIRGQGPSSTGVMRRDPSDLRVDDPVRLSRRSHAVSLPRTDF